MELAHLQSFLAVHRHGNVSHAARALQLAQPTVTSHIRALESELGRPLFVRLPRGVSPTTLADRLAAEVSPSLDTLRTAIEGFLSEPDSSGGTLLLGGPVDLLAEVVLPRLMALVEQGLAVRVTTGLTGDLLTALADRELDIVLATTPSRRRGVTMTRLFDERLVLCASPRTARQLGRAANLSTLAADGWRDMLAQLPMAAYDEHAPLVRRYWRSVFDSGVAPTPRIVVDDLRAVARTVAAGAVWSVLPHYLISGRLDSGELVELHRPPTAPTNTLYIANRAGDDRRGVVARVRQHLLSTAFPPA
jgi:DNA-binding transcriptional LysR family regulator